MRRFINNVIFQKISRLKHPERLELNLIWVQVAGLNPNVRTSLLLQTLRAVPRNSGVLSAVQIPHYSSSPQVPWSRLSESPRGDQTSPIWLQVGHDVDVFFLQLSAKKNDRARRRVAVTVGKTEHLDSAYVR